VPQRTGSGQLLAALSMNASQNSQPLAQSVPRSQPSHSSGPISRKLPGGQVQCIELSDSDDSDGGSHKFKRPRLESPVKQPLGTKNPNIQTVPTPQFTQQKPSSLLKQQSVGHATSALPVGSPSKSKENSTVAPAPPQITLQQLEERRKLLGESILRYQLEILQAKRRTGVKAKRDVERATNHLQNSRAESERINRQVIELSRLLMPAAGPSSHPVATRPLTTQAITQPPPATQMVLPTWQSRLGDPASVTGPGSDFFVDDDVSDGDAPMQFPQLTQLQRPIMGPRVKATVNE
jgi:hypothetical protein